ncbi:phage tail protein I [Caballeronia sp. HLA56]
MNKLLPPNATRLERRFAVTSTCIDDIPTPLATLIDPETIRLDLLPWLAWQLGVDTWKGYWPEHVKRARVKQAIPVARRKGTAAAVREVVAAFGGNLVLREWFELRPPGAPGTFEILLTVSGQEGEPPTAEYVADICAEIDRTKPLRAHYTFTQGFSKQTRQTVGGAARAAVYRRLTLTEPRGS